MVEEVLTDTVRVGELARDKFILTIHPKKKACARELDIFIIFIFRFES
jgi:hypothetical protein